MHPAKPSATNARTAFQTAASDAASYADDFETESIADSPQPSVGVRRSITFGVAAGHPPLSRSVSKSYGGIPPPLLGAPQPGGAATAAFSPGLRLSLRRNTIRGLEIPDRNSMTELPAPLPPAEKRPASPAVAAPTAAARAPGSAPDGPLLTPQYAAPAAAGTPLWQQGGGPSSALQSLAQSTLLRYQALLASGSLNLPGLNPMGLASMRPLPASCQQGAGGHLPLHAAPAAASQYLSMGLNNPPPPSPYYPTLGLTAPFPSPPASYPAAVGLDPSSVASVRLGLLGAAASAASDITASSIVHEQVAEGELRAGIDRLRARLGRQQQQGGTTTMSASATVAAGLYSAAAVGGGPPSYSYSGPRPGSAAPGLALPRDREVVLDPVTRQLVDVGGAARGGAAAGYHYTTLEDTMRLIRAHREGGAVAVAWG